MTPGSAPTERLQAAGGAAPVTASHPAGSERLRADVAVLGGGTAGAVVAAALARRGASVVLVEATDRSTCTSSRGRGERTARGSCTCPRAC